MEKEISRLLEFGIINIDKSSGPTSFDVSNYVCKKLGLRKTSHFGTLDPKVTGVLPISLNRACKLAGYFLGEDKTYVGIMRFHEEVELNKVKEIIRGKFMGDIYQTPPLKSRVKRVERKREIKRFEILETEGKDFLFEVECQGGTYIRKLVDDLGKELGVGAHMLELRRTKAGIFSEEKIYTLYEFEKAVDAHKNGNSNELSKMIVPATEAIKKVHPEVQIKEDGLSQIYTGKPIYKKDVVKDEGWKVDDVACVFCGDKFVGMYKIFRGKEIFAKPEFVMQPVRG